MARAPGKAQRRWVRWRWPAVGLLARLEAEQDRWFLWLPVLFGCGIALYFGALREPDVVPALGALAVAVLLAVVWRHGLVATVVTAALVMTTAGFASAKLRTERARAPVIERAMGPVGVTGWIELVEPRPGRGQRLSIRVAAIDGLLPAATPQRVRIRTLGGDEALKPGQAVRVAAFLQPPTGPALPGGFDFARAAWFQGLGAVGSARAPPEPVMIAAPMPRDLAWRGPIERVRQAITRRIGAALPGETGSIAAALISGERGGISDATNDAFRDSGLFHILSISGLHMVIMAGAVFLSARFLLTLVPAIALNYPIKKWSAFAAALGALAYLLISGASFPTVRSYIMISIMLLAVLLDRPAVALRNVALAALSILAIYPESSADVGFQMSFAAVVALVAAYEAIRDRAGEVGARRGMVLSLALFFGGIVLTTLIASVAVAPFGVYHFHKTQQYAVLANLIAIPICNILVMPAALAALVAMPVGLEAWPLRVMGWGIEAMVWCAHKVAALPGAVGRLPEFPTLAFALLVAGGLWLCLWRQHWRLAGLVLIAAGLAVAPLRQGPDILIGRDGLVVIRQADGRLSALGSSQASFDLARMLEHDGDERRAEEVLAARAFRCDWTGCVARTKGTLVAVARHAAALADDCRRAGIVIFNGALAAREGGGGSTPMRGARPSHEPRSGRPDDRAGGAQGDAADPRAGAVDGRGPCAAPMLVVDAMTMSRTGPLAIRLGPGKGAPGAAGVDGQFTAAVATAVTPVVTTVAGERGDRPWSATPVRSLDPRGFARPAREAAGTRRTERDAGRTNPDPDPGSPSERPPAADDAPAQATPPPSPRAGWQDNAPAPPDTPDDP